MEPNLHPFAPLFGILGSAIALLAFVPYGIGIYQRKIRPHIFTWLIWSIVTLVAAEGQLAAGAGPSAWCTAAIAFTCVATLVASFFRGEGGRTKSDWAFLLIALAAVPVWLFTNDPTISVCLVTLIEVAGFGPTVRKTMRDPWSDSLFYFVLCVLKYTFAVLALEKWSLAAAIYPTVTVAAAGSLCILIIARRSMVPRGIASK